MRATPRVFALIIVFVLASWSASGLAQPAQPEPPQPPPPAQQPSSFTPNELVSAGQQFFGTVSRGLATLIEKAVSQWGLPNGYVLGEEGGAAFFGGLLIGLRIGIDRTVVRHGSCTEL